MNIRNVTITVALSVVLVAPLVAQEGAAPSAGTDHVTAIKQSLQASMAAVRQYQWVETTVVSIKGEEKSRAQKSCYYGADGKVQKTPMGDPAADSKKQRGVRGKIVENKKEEISASMQEAMALVQQYVPPDAARIQAAKDAGRVTVTPPNAQGAVQVVIKEYLKADDSLAFDLNAATNVISGVTIATFTDTAKDVVRLQVSFATFADGTVYTAAVHLDVISENLAVEIENSGYKKLGG